MKKIIHLLGLILISILLMYCAKDNEFQDEFSANHKEQFNNEIDEIIQDALSTNYSQAQLDSATSYLVKNQGYDINELVSTPHGLIYENDIVLSVEDILSEIKDKDRATSRSKFRHVDKITRVKNVQFGVIVKGDAALPQKWRNSLDSAIKNWNSGNGDLGFRKRLYSRYVNNKYTENITWVIPIDFNRFKWYQNLTNKNRAYAWAYAPKNGRPGKWIFINTDINFFTNASSKARRQTLIHEIGHVIGFKHTGSTHGSQLTGLSKTCSKSNVASVMRSSPSSASLVLTTCDKEAFDKLY